MWIGALCGPSFLLCFSAILGKPLSEGIAYLTAYASTPVFFVLGEVLHTSCIPFGILVLLVYWLFLGMGLACGLAWLYFFIVRRLWATSDTA